MYTGPTERFGILLPGETRGVGVQYSQSVRRENTSFAYDVLYDDIGNDGVGPGDRLALRSFGEYYLDKDLDGIVDYARIQALALPQLLAIEMYPDSTSELGVAARCVDTGAVQRAAQDNFETGLRYFVKYFHPDKE